MDKKWKAQVSWAGDIGHLCCLKVDLEYIFYV